MLDQDYIKKLKERAGTSRAYSRHQALGIELAETLSDLKHTALYIKLAQKMDSQRLMGIAKEVASNKEVKNKGAYFMRVAMGERKDVKTKK